MSESVHPSTPSKGNFLVDQVYEEALDRMGEIGRLKHGFSLYQFAFNVLHCQLSKQYPELGENQLKIKIAEIMYLSDAKAQVLLKRAACS